MGQLKRKIKKCKFCGKEFEAYGKQVCCGDIECKRAQNRLSYLHRMIKGTCKICGKEFEATKGKVYTGICFECKKNYHTQKVYQTYEQKEVCYRCGKVLNIKIKNLTREPKYEIRKGLCEECKKFYSEQSSDRMKLNNPNKYASQYENMTEWISAQDAKKRAQEEKIQNKEVREKERREASSQRMKKFNPMHNPESIKKGKETYWKRVKEGKIKIKRGSERYNWKGGYTDLKIALRRSLKEWRIANLKRSGYKCEKCGKTCDNLNIHHLEPFREILKKGLDTLNLKLDDLKYLDENYMKLEKWIQEYHANNNIGMVLCPDCHDKIDECFHKQKKPRRDLYVEKNRKNKKNKI